jgi:hypothetical protein
MSSIRFETNADIAKWKKALGSMKNIVDLAKSEKRQFKQFCDREIETAQFWDRYARERTTDLKLREIASSELNRVITDVEMMNNEVIDLYEKVFNYLKNIKIKEEKR